MRTTKGFLVGLGVLALLVMAAGLVYASDPPPGREPETSPFFEATLQQAVDELDGKVTAPGPGADLRAPPPYPTQHYTGDSRVWPQECGPYGYTWNPLQSPKCHYTSDPSTWPEACRETYPTIDYTWDSTIWNDCGPDITRDPKTFWCDPLWTTDPEWIQCDPLYTRDPAQWVWCSPRFTQDLAQWKLCDDPSYTKDSKVWPECDFAPTTDPHLWPECHFTSDPSDKLCYDSYPTQDYTSNPKIWPECDPAYTSTPTELACEDREYTSNTQRWPWCDPAYTTQPQQWPACHYTSDPGADDCTRPWPTKDYTWDSVLWKTCGDKITQDAEGWWCDPRWTHDPAMPLCDPTFTWHPDSGAQCETDYTYDPGLSACAKYGYYTSTPNGWDVCAYPTADARLWPECHYTSDPATWKECGQDDPFPTKDFTTDPRIWKDCVVDEPANYTTDPTGWPTCHYTSDPVSWADCKEPLADLGDAPDSSNHTPSGMTAYPAVAAKYPTVFDPATGLPEGPKHWKPRADAWLGPWVTLENDADLLPDEDTVANIDPPGDTPNRDRADDGLLYPVKLDNCVSTVFSYTVTVAPGAPVNRRFVNVWFDWNRDGDWGDAPECPDGTPAPEWAVQDHVVTLGPGTHVLQTPAFLPVNSSPGDPMWMRISIADGRAPPVPGTAIADGRGSPNGYQYGETEDYLLREQDPDYDIYMKDNGADDGSVPSSGLNWNSPDLWIRNDGDCTNSAHQNPVMGTTTTICVRVRNRLPAAVDDITVEVYWAAAALGMTWPASFTYVGSTHIANLPVGGVKVKPVPWTVPTTTGHFCFWALADAPKDPVGSGFDTVLPVFVVRNNNNIVQKNVQVIDFEKVYKCGFFSTKIQTDTIRFDVVNTKGTSTNVSVIFSSSDFPLGSGKVVVEPGDLWGRWNRLGGFNQVGQTLVVASFPATMESMSMAAHETVATTMTVSAVIDERFTISVSEKAGGNTVGGIQYIRRLPICRYLPLVMKNAR